MQSAPSLEIVTRGNLGGNVTIRQPTTSTPTQASSGSRAARADANGSATSRQRQSRRPTATSVSGSEFNVSNRQKATLLRVPNGHVVAAVINAAMHAEGGSV